MDTIFPEIEFKTIPEMQNSLLVVPIEGPLVSKVILHCFEAEDLAHLKQIGFEISERINAEKKEITVRKTILSFLKDVFTK